MRNVQFCDFTNWRIIGVCDKTQSFMLGKYIKGTITFAF